MIPRADIVAWQEHAPWADESQVEQDLLISRAVVELFSGPKVASLLAFRGGTALHKLYLAPPARFSEDIDLVQVAPGPSRLIFEAIQERLDPWLGSPTRKQKNNGVQLLYRFETELTPVRKMRLKVEVHTREHFSVLGHVHHRFDVDSRWFSGSAEVPTYHLDELLGTKLRALYQRKKGRDLFDLWEAHQRGSIDPQVIVRCMKAYLEHQGLSISQAEFELNLADKLTDPAFVDDTLLLLRRGLSYDLEEAAHFCQERLLVLL